MTGVSNEPTTNAPVKGNVHSPASSGDNPRYQLEKLRDEDVAAEDREGRDQVSDQGCAEGRDPE